MTISTKACNCLLFPLIGSMISFEVPNHIIRPIKQFDFSKGEWCLTYTTGSYLPPGDKWVPIIYELNNKEIICRFAKDFALKPTGGEFGVLNGRIDLYYNNNLMYSIIAEVNPNGTVVFSDPVIGGLQELSPHPFSKLFLQMKRIK